MGRTEGKVMTEVEKVGKEEVMIARVKQRKNMPIVTAPSESLKQCSKKGRSPSRSSTTL